MSKFIVGAEIIVHRFQEVEADNEDEALELASTINYNQWMESSIGGQEFIDNVEVIEEVTNVVIKKPKKKGKKK